jgi:hypothetical protein
MNVPACPGVLVSAQRKSLRHSDRQNGDRDGQVDCKKRAQH